MTSQEQIKLALETSDLSRFSFREYELAGDTVVLCNPIPFFRDYTKDNEILRSIIYRKSDFYPVSLGLKKFYNTGERSDLYSLPNNLDQCEIFNKIDGSCLICSLYKGQFIFRTRGSLDTLSHDTSKEVLELVGDYAIKGLLTIFQGNISLIFEYITPNHTIVKKYPKPDLILTNIIEHSDYSYRKQQSVDVLALNWGLKRPVKYTFPTFDEMFKDVKGFEDEEGVVIYFNGGQSLLKAKADRYLKLHKLKSSLGSINNLIDVYFEYTESAHIGNFYHYISTIYDYEIAQYVKPQIELIEYIAALFNNINDDIELFCAKYKDLSKKEFALEVISRYNKENQSLYFEYKTKNKISAETRKKWLIKELSLGCKEVKAEKNEEN